MNGVQNLKVAYVTVQFPVPSETFASNEVRELSAEGVEISVHGLRRAHRDHERLVVERGLRSIRIAHNRFSASMRGALDALSRPRLLLKSLQWLVRATGSNRRDLVMSLAILPRSFNILSQIERERPEVVHMYWGHFPAVVGFLVQERCPWVVTSISIVAYDLVRRYGGTVCVARRADVVRTHAHVNLGQLSEFTGLAPERVNVIYNGVDVPKLASASRRGNNHRVPQRIVTVARLVEDKGVDDVLRAFSSVRTRWPLATLLVVGDGPDRSRLRDMCASLGLEEAVEFTGSLSHDRAIEEMAKAEIMLLMSRCRDERLPNVIKEAMVCGCICIASATPGIEELVVHGVSGFVVPMSDPGAASRRIDQVFEGQIDVVGMTASAAQHINQHFDLHHTAPTYRGLWQAALGRRITDTELPSGSLRGAW